MTTPSISLPPGATYVYVEMEHGYQRVRPWIAQGALERGEIELTDTPGLVRLIPQPIREMSPEERRAWVLKKERDKKDRRR